MNPKFGFQNTRCFFEDYFGLKICNNVKRSFDIMTTKNDVAAIRSFY